MILALDDDVPDGVADAIRAHEAVLDLWTIRLGPRPLTRWPTPRARSIPDGLDATLVLVRHGESEFIVEGRFQGQAESPLSPLGRRQAALVGDAPGRARTCRRPCRCPRRPAARSSTRRSAGRPQTAEAIARGRSGPPARPSPRRPDPGFLEIAQGDWEGLHRDEVAARYGDRARGLAARADRGLGARRRVARRGRGRVRPALAAILGRLADGRRARARSTAPRSRATATPPPTHPWSIVVGHDGVFKVTLLTLFDLPLERFWMWSMDLCGDHGRRVPGRPAGPARAQPDRPPGAPLPDEAAPEADAGATRSSRERRASRIGGALERRRQRRGAGDRAGTASRSSATRSRRCGVAQRAQAIVAEHAPGRRPTRPWPAPRSRARGRTRAAPRPAPRRTRRPSGSGAARSRTERRGASTDAVGVVRRRPRRAARAAR